MYADGTVITGDFADDMPHGDVVLVSPDGSRYEGEFVKGRRNGFGKLTMKNGTVYEGQFKDDEFISP